MIAGTSASEPGAPYFALSVAERAFRAEARAWARAVVEPCADAASRGTFPAEAIRDAARSGYLGLLVPRSLGGLGLSHLCFAVLIEEVAACCASTAVIMDVHASVGTEPIASFGTLEQRERWLPLLAGGHVLGAFALTEPEAGSDAGAVATTATRTDSAYTLDGSKTFISNAGRAGIYTVIASTDRRLGARGLSAFLVPAGTPGLHIDPPQHKMGLHGAVTAELSFRGCRIPLDHRLSEEGDGFRIAMIALDSGRIGISAQALGLAAAAMREAIRLLQASEPPDSIPQSTACALARMATRIEAARALTWEAARACDAGAPYTAAAAMAKLSATDAAMDVATQAIDLVADRAAYADLDRLERVFLDAKATQIYEGTNQIQRLVIARDVLGT